MGAIDRHRKRWAVGVCYAPDAMKRYTRLQIGQ